MTTNSQKKMQKNAKKFYCKYCDFHTSNKFNYDKHLLTAKHQNTTKYVENTIFLQENARPGEQFICQCGKTYPYRGSLYNHKKKCTFISGDKLTNKVMDHMTNICSKTPKEESKELILKLVEENTEIRSLLFNQFETMQTQMYEQQKQMHEQINELIPRVGNNNTINKQKLNINIFLNEQCKDALTMEQFIKKIEVTLGDLLVTKNKGLSEGVSNIFIENMNKLSLYERPLHCTDVKREIVYIKSEDGQVKGNAQWERDDANIKLKQALKKVTHMQAQSLEKWVAEHPNWEQNSDEQEEYMKLVKNCTDTLSDKENKVIKKLCNQAHVNIDDN
jgi:hypothetical protein